MTQLSTLEQLCFCTSRLEAKDREGHFVYGTGFFYLFSLEQEGKGLIYLLTNRHMVKDMTEIRFGISRKDTNGFPQYGPPLYQIYEMTSEILYHPDENIDLCAIPVTMFFKIRERNGQSLFYRHFDSSLIPTKQQREELEPVEDIMLIGYPNALWDERHNMPLIRKGITASAPYLDFNGKREFVIDAACFNGSSGSPVILYDKGMYRDKRNQSLVLGSRFYFLGILYGGPSSLVKGTLHTKKSLGDSTSTITARVPNNLGYVINSEVIWDFIPLVEKQNNVKIKQK